MTARGVELVDDFIDKARKMDNPIGTWLSDLLTESKDGLLESEEALTKWVHAALSGRDACVRDEEIHVFMDGNAWTAHRAKGYRNMMEDPTGFGDTPEGAVTSLLKEEA